MALQLHRVIPNAGDGEVHVGGAGVVHLPDDWADGPGLADLVTGLGEGVTSQVAFRKIAGWLIGIEDESPSFALAVETADGLLSMVAGAGRAELVDSGEAALVGDVDGAWNHRLYGADAHLVLGERPTRTSSRMDFRDGVVFASGVELASRRTDIADGDSASESASDADEDPGAAGSAGAAVVGAGLLGAASLGTSDGDEAEPSEADLQSIPDCGFGTGTGDDDANADGSVAALAGDFGGVETGADGVSLDATMESDDDGVVIGDSALEADLTEVADSTDVDADWSVDEFDGSADLSVANLADDEVDGIGDLALSDEGEGVDATDADVSIEVPDVDGIAVDGMSDLDLDAAVDAAVPDLAIGDVDGAAAVTVDGLDLADPGVDADISGGDLPNVDLPHVDLAGVDLPDVGLSGVDLPSVDSLDVDGPDFGADVDLSGVDVSTVDIGDLDAGLDASPADIDANIDLGSMDGDLPAVDVAGVDVPNVDLSGVDLPDVGLSGVDLPNVDLPNVDLPDVGLSGVDLPNVDLPDVGLSGVDLPNVDLPNVDLPNVDLPDVGLSGVDLPNVDLPDVDIPGVDIPKVDIDAAVDLDGSNIDLGGLETPDVELNPVDLDASSLDIADVEAALTMDGSTEPDGYEFDGVSARLGDRESDRSIVELQEIDTGIGTSLGDVDLGSLPDGLDVDAGADVEVDPAIFQAETTGFDMAADLGIDPSVSASAVGSTGGTDELPMWMVGDAETPKLATSGGFTSEDLPSWVNDGANAVGDVDVASESLDAGLADDSIAAPIDLDLERFRRTQGLSDDAEAMADPLDGPNWSLDPDDPLDPPTMAVGTVSGFTDSGLVTTDGTDIGTDSYHDIPGSTKESAFDPDAPAGSGVYLDEEGPDVPEIVGLQCSLGHLNSPSWKRCGTCGQDLKGAVPGRGRHPGLGLIMFDDGSTLPINAGYLIGRRPNPDAVGEGSLQALVINDESQSVSRNHAILRVDGWELMISDCESANGTHVETGTDLLRLEPGEPYPLADGQRVVVGTRWFEYRSAGRD